MAAPRVVKPDYEIRTLTGIVLSAPGLSDNAIKRLQKYMYRNCLLHKLITRVFTIYFNIDDNKDVVNASVSGDLPIGSQPKILKVFKDGMKLIDHNLKGNYHYEVILSFKKGRVVSLKSL